MEHYGRWRRSGDPEYQPAAPTGWTTHYGYRQISTALEPHPLEMADKRIFEHRAVLYAKIGPGEHPCTWCGRMVTWDESWPESMDALVTDPLELRPTRQPAGESRSILSAVQLHTARLMTPR